MRETLLKIIKSQNLHKKWLNTVSHLEYIGSRKIIKSLNAEIIGLEELQHFYEEAGHALLLKKIGHEHFPDFPKTYDPKNLLGGSLGNDYFQTLDQYISDQLGTAKTLFNYLYVTWLIEERAMKVYSQYNNLLLKHKAPFNITELIKEEIGHLEETTVFLEMKDPDFEQNKSDFMNKEEELFQKLWATIEAETLAENFVETLNA